MVKSLSVASVIEKNRLDSDQAYLICVDIEVVNPTTGVVVEVIHVVRNTEPVTLNSVVYEAANFDIELKEEAGTQPTLNFIFRDLTRALQARMQEYGGGIGFNVTLKVVAANALTAPAELEEFFQVIGAQISNFIVTFTLGAENSLFRTFPRRRQTKDFCQWRYKDPTTCGYSGGMPTCDLSLQGPNGCAAHSNTPKFGAFPGLNTNGLRYV